jgi:hypothetical protein
MSLFFTRHCWWIRAVDLRGGDGGVVMVGVVRTEARGSG